MIDRSLNNTVYMQSEKKSENDVLLPILYFTRGTIFCNVYLFFAKTVLSLSDIRSMELNQKLHVTYNCNCKSINLDRSEVYFLIDFVVKPKYAKFLIN